MDIIIRNITLVDFQGNLNLSTILLSKLLYGVNEDSFTVELTYLAIEITVHHCLDGDSDKATMR